MQGFGYRLDYEDGELIFASRPRPRQRLLLVVSVIAAPLIAAAGIAAGQPVIAAAGFLAVASVAIFFYRELKVASSEQLVLEKNGQLKWVKVPKLSKEEFTRRLEDITPDEQDCLFKIAVLEHNAPGSRVMEGIPATVWVYMSRGPGAGYEKLLMARTLTKEIDPIMEALLEKLPRSRRD